MSNYVDRGLIKWMPFDALTGFGEMIYELTHRHELKEKPILSEDMLAMFDYTLSEAYQNQQILYVTYIKSKRMYETKGYIRKIDPYKRTLLLSSLEVISIDDIIHLML
jgi:hypothetical protein